MKIGKLYCAYDPTIVNRRFFDENKARLIRKITAYGLSRKINGTLFLLNPGSSELIPIKWDYIDDISTEGKEV